MIFELSGKLYEVFDIKQINDNFRKREFVVETSEFSNGREFIEHIKFQLIQDKCSLIDGYGTGDLVKVKFNIKGRKWESADGVKYFTNLDCWAIEKIQSNDTADDSPPPPEEPLLPEDFDDDVPF